MPQSYFELYKQSRQFEGIPPAVAYSGFPNGVNLADNPREIDLSQAQRLVNVSFDPNGKLAYRGGSFKLSGTAQHGVDPSTATDVNTVAIGDFLFYHQGITVNPDTSTNIPSSSILFLGSRGFNDSVTPTTWGTQDIYFWPFAGSASLVPRIINANVSPAATYNPMDIRMLQFESLAFTTTGFNSPLLFYQANNPITDLGGGNTSPVPAFNPVGLPPPPDACIPHLDRFADIGTPLFDSPGAGGTLPDGTSGYPDSTVGTPYSYVYTCTDAYGNTSNPSPESAQIASVNQRILLDFPSAATYFPDNDIQQVDVYRRGGTSSILTLVLTFQPAILVALHEYMDINYSDPTWAFANWQHVMNSGDPFYSSTVGGQAVGYVGDYWPNSYITDQIPAYYNLPPPLGFQTIGLHQQRLFGAGTPSGQAITDVSGSFQTALAIGSESQLWTSVPNSPLQWGFDNTNATDDSAGFVDIDGNSADGILCFESTGSILIIGRQQSVYAMYGSGLQSFRFAKISNIGVASRKSMVRQDNIVRYFGADGRFYEVQNETPVVISQSVMGALADIPASALSSAVCWQHDRKVYVSISLDYGQTTTTFPDGMACFFLDLDRPYTFNNFTVYGVGQVDDPMYRCRSAKSVVVPIGTLNLSGFYGDSEARPLLFTAPTEQTCGLVRVNIPVNKGATGEYAILSPSDFTSLDSAILIESPWYHYGNYNDIGVPTYIFIEGDIVPASNGDPLVLTLCVLQGKVEYTFDFDLPIQQYSGGNITPAQWVDHVGYAIIPTLLEMVDPPAYLQGKAFKMKISGTMQGGFIGRFGFEWNRLRRGNQAI